MSEKDKKCGGCGQTKPLSAFHNCVGKRDGHASQCAECQKARRSRDKERIAKYQKEYRARNLEKCKRTSNAWKANHKDRVSEYNKQYDSENNGTLRKRRCFETYQAKWRKERRLRKYGTDGSAELATQGGVCAICEKAISLEDAKTHVDHCHTSGLVRGVLCANCNLGIGHFNDDAALLRRAIDYLETTGIFA